MPSNRLYYPLYLTLFVYYSNVIHFLKEEPIEATLYKDVYDIKDAKSLLILPFILKLICLLHLILVKRKTNILLYANNRTAG